MARSAPGRHYREGISLMEVMAMFPDDDAAERWFEEARWGAAGEPDRCPMCGGTERLRPAPNRRPLPYWCGSCRRHFSVRTNSVMHRSRIPLRKWAVATYLWAVSLKGVSSMRLHRDLGITQKSAYHMAQRLRAAWADMPTGMRGPAEADETYVGGRVPNMSLRRRRERTERGGGSGPADKAVVAGVRDRATGQVAVRVVGGATARELQGLVRDHVEPGARLYTDEHRAYAGLREDYRHEVVWHGGDEYARGQVHVNGMESHWATLKRAVSGTFHKVSPKHLPLYAGEFATRHNLRPLDTEAIMAETAARMAGRRLTYRDLIADCGLPSGARPTAAAVADGGRAT